MSTITTAIAAQRLGISPRRVRALIAAGRLPAAPFGRDWSIQESDLALVADRKPGRPRRAHDAAPSHDGSRIG